MKRGIILFMTLLLVFQPDLQAQKSKSQKNKKGTTPIESKAINYNALPSGVTKGASVEGITEYFLANGLQVLLYPDPSKQTMTVNLTYKVGSRHEAYGETGMAHLLEHMVFKGTPRHPNIPAELTKHGARPNGTTWYDRTNYFETFSASEENLRWALDLEADRMVNSFIAKKDLDTEMTVVRNEFESGENSPFRVLLERVLSTSYLWHNYGKSTIGARADIEKVPIERLQGFYKKYYQPDNAVLMVAGKIDEKKTIWMVHEYFSSIPKPDRYIYPTYTEEPTQDGERSVSLRRTGDVQLAAACYHIPPGSHPDAAACELLLSVLTNEPSGRLYKALVETKKAASVGGFSLALKEPGFSYIFSEIRLDKSFDEANQVMMNTIDNIANQPPTNEEVERARNKKLKDIELFLRNTEQVGTTISEYIGMGDWRLVFIYRDNIRKATAEDLQRVASRYFKSSNRTVGRFIPEAKPDRSEIPQAPDIANLVKDYKGDAPIAQGEDFDPSPKNIESRLQRNNAMNGLQYVLLPKQTKGNIVNANITLRIGDENSLKNKLTISDFAAGMLDQGTANRTKQQIKDELDVLKARVNVFGSGGTVNLTIQTTKENLPAVIKIVGDMLKNSKFNSTEFEEMREAVLADLEQNKNEPQFLANKTLDRHLNPYPKGDIRYRETIEEEIASTKEVKLEDCKKFYKEFYGASNATISIVGDFDKEQIKPLIETEFGSWKNPIPYKRIPDPYIQVPPLNENIETVDKANATFFAGMNLEIKDDDPDYAALVLGNYILGGGFLNSRLAVRIRQKEGLSYGVGSQFFADSRDRSGGFFAFAIYAPENRVKLEAAFKEELERFAKEGITAAELEDARTGLLQSRKVSRSQDPNLSASLNSLLDLGRTFQFVEDLENRMLALTPEMVNAAIKKHIDPSKLSMVKAGDFANKLKKP